jgi:ECF sigma factor
VRGIQEFSWSLAALALPAQPRYGVGLGDTDLLGARGAIGRGMTPPLPHNVTQLLRAWSQGERAALDELLPLVYRELHRQAERFMRAQSPGHTLQVTGLVHEAYLRLVDQDGVEWQSRAHFFGVAGKAMRSILVDHARARGAVKRGAGVRQLTLGAASGAAGRVLTRHQITPGRQRRELT